MTHNIFDIQLLSDFVLSTLINQEEHYSNNHHDAQYYNRRVSSPPHFVEYSLVHVGIYRPSTTTASSFGGDTIISTRF
jgi:hypothetical protein